jgi:hypothetical protein
MEIKMTRIYKIDAHRNIGAMDADHEWCAYDDLTYCGEETDPVGYGRTPREAIENLLDLLFEE